MGGRRLARLVAKGSGMELGSAGRGRVRFGRIFPGARKGVIEAIVLLLSVGLSAEAVGQQNVHATLIPVATRVAAPSFNLAGETGTAVQLSDYRGKVVLLNFWATQCGGCVLEVPYFVAIQSELKGEGFTVVGISMDRSYEELKTADVAWGKVRPFVAAHKLNYPILMGDSSLLEAYKLNFLPMTYLIDKSGRTAAVYGGVVSKDDVEANLKTLLSEH
jgi:peroxiredoxin